MCYKKIKQEARTIKLLVLKKLNKYRSNKVVFNDIYKYNLWYSDEVSSNEFNSGGGSDKKYSISYINFLKKYLNNNSNIKRVVDLGCGDFRVGQRLVNSVSLHEYIGIDVVPTLIKYLNKNFSTETPTTRYLTHRRMIIFAI